MTDLSPTPHFRDAPLPRWVVQAQRRDMRDVAFTHDGGHIVSIGDDAPIHLWSAFTGEKIRSFAGHKRGGEALAVHPDGERLFSAGRDKTLRVWHLWTGEQLAVFEGHTGGVTAVAISADGAFVASGSTDRTVRVWDAHRGDCIATWRGHRDPICMVTFTDLGGFPWVWSGCTSGVMLGGPVGAEKPQHTAGGDRIIARDPHNDRIIVRSSFHDAAEASQAAVRLFGPDGIGPPESHLRGHLGEVRCATFTPDGIALTGSADRGLRRFAIDGSLASHLRAGGAGCDVLAVQPQGELVALGDADGRLLVFDGDAVFEAELSPPHSHAITAVGFDPEGRPWSMGRDGQFVVRDTALAPIESHALRKVRSMHNAAGYIGGGWWRHGPVTVSSTRARGLERWEMINRPSVECYRTTAGASIDGVAVGAERIALATLDPALYILDAETLRDVARIELGSYPLAVAIGPDDRVAVADEKGGLLVCDRDGADATTTQAGRITALAFAPDGALYLGDRSGRLIRHGAGEGDNPSEPAAGHAARIVVLAVADDGRTVFTAGADRVVIGWRDLKPVTRWTLPVPVMALAPDGRDGVLYGDAAGAMGRLTLPGPWVD